MPSASSNPADTTGGNKVHKVINELELLWMKWHRRVTHTSAVHTDRCGREGGTPRIQILRQGWAMVVEPTARGGVGTVGSAGTFGWGEHIGGQPCSPRKGWIHWVSVYLYLYGGSLR